MQIMDVEGFRARYPDWIEATRPLLDDKNWKDAFKTFPFPTNTDSPWTAVSKPLAQSRLALLTTAGLYVQGEQPPFDAENVEGDWTFRELPDDVALDRLGIAHDHFDHTRALADLNCVYPHDRLRELVAEGLIGELAPVHFSISGYCTRPDLVAEHAAPQIATRLKQLQVDALLQVPV